MSMHVLPPGRSPAEAPGRAMPTHTPGPLHAAAQSPGSPLDATTGAIMEPRLGHDFSRVRVHAGGRTGEAAWPVGARVPGTEAHTPWAAESTLATRSATRSSGSSGESLISGVGGAGPGEGRNDPFPSPGPPPAAPSERDDPGATASPPGDAAPMATTAVSEIVANIGSTGLDIAHVPPCGRQPTIRFTAKPSSAAPVTWSIDPGSAAGVAAGTVLTPATSTLTATLALGAAQKGGILDIKADNSQGGTVTPYRLASHPTGIASTSVIGDPVDTRLYGGVFNQQFTSHDGQASSLEEVAVGERFPHVPTPDAATHTFPTPFGSFTLTTGTLPDTPSAGTGDWFLTDTGELGATGDTVGYRKSLLDIGNHLASDSNPSPAHPMPVQFVVDQQFFWWCPHAPAGHRWAHVADTTHTRVLRETQGGAGAEFAAIVNTKENAMDYEGVTGVAKARANPATVAPSSGGSVNTVQIQADAFPATRTLFFSIRGNAHGCTIDHATGELTIGALTGTVKVRAANKSGGSNWDEVDVVIAAPQMPAPPPAPAPPGGANPAPSPPPHGGGAGGSSLDAQRKCACGPGDVGADGECLSCRDNRPVLQRSPAGRTAAEARTRKPTAPIDVEKVLASSGTVLPETVRGFMGPRFGVNFETVRIHADDVAAQSARALSARAYTVGSHLVFRDGEYQPGSPAGQRLLAHELTHVVQQQGPGHAGGAAGAPASRVRNDQADGLVVSQPGDRYEQEADRVAEQIMQSPGADAGRSPAAAPRSGAESAHPVQRPVNAGPWLQRQHAAKPGESDTPGEDPSLVPAVVKSRRGTTGWIKDPSAGGSLDEKQWAATDRTEIKKLCSDAAKVAQVEKVFVGPAAVPKVADDINIVDAGARDHRPGLNSSTLLYERAETAYVAAAGGGLMNTLTPSPADPLPKIAIVLGAHALSSKGVALGALRHEMVHVEHLNLALMGLFKLGRDAVTAL